MTKLFNTQVFTKGSEYWLRYWTEEKPDKEYYSKSLARLSNYSIYLKKWQSSFKEVRIHPSCVEGFKELAIDFLVSMYKNIPDVEVHFSVGVSIPPDNVIVDYYTDKDSEGPTLYAFLINAVEKKGKKQCETCKFINECRFIQDNANNSCKFFIDSSPPPSSKVVQEETQDEIWKDYDDFKQREYFDSPWRSVEDFIKLRKTKYTITKL